MPGRYPSIPNVEKTSDKKYLLVNVPANFKRRFSARCRELKIPQATYLMRLFDMDSQNKAPMSDEAYRAALAESDTSICNRFNRPDGIASPKNGEE